VRTQRFAYFEHRRGKFSRLAEGIEAAIGVGRTTERELYDLARDPNQLRNVAGDRRYGVSERELAALVARLERCEGEQCVLSARVSPPRR
jgi:hypothetical protein